jgi:hypothetical protein
MPSQSRPCGSNRLSGIAEKMCASEGELLRAHPELKRTPTVRIVPGFLSECTMLSRIFRPCALHAGVPPEGPVVRRIFRPDAPSTLDGLVYPHKMSSTVVAYDRAPGKIISPETP